MSTSVHSIIAALAQKLLSICNNLQTAEQESWWLLEKITQKTKASLLAALTITLTPQEQAMLESFIHERVKLKKPLQYILGSVPFCNLNIIIKPPILIPRPETEEWVTWLINSLEPIKNQPLDILDLCTGSGCISLALAKALPQATIIGIDINKAAIELAQENMYHNKIDNCVFLQSDLYQAIPPNQQFDLIVSNPPYLSEVEWHNLDYSVKNWEDKQALRADNAGMALYEKIITQAPTYLKKSSILTPLKLPQIILELGTQHRYIQKTLEVRNFINIILHSDLQGKIRWISACV